jgi:TPR repeat protein
MTNESKPIVDWRPRYPDGTLIEKGDAVLCSGVPARIIDVFEENPPSVLFEDAERPGRHFVNAAELLDLTLIERNTLDFARAGIDWLCTQAKSGDAYAQAALGWLYETGVAVDQDIQQAIRWQREAEAAGCG